MPSLKHFGNLNFNSICSAIYLEMLRRLEYFAAPSKGIFVRIVKTFVEILFEKWRQLRCRFSSRSCCKLLGARRWRISQNWAPTVIAVQAVIQEKLGTGLDSSQDQTPQALRRESMRE